MFSNVFPSFLQFLQLCSVDEKTLLLCPGWQPSCLQQSAGRRCSQLLIGLKWWLLGNPEPSLLALYARRLQHNKQVIGAPAAWLTPRQVGRPTWGTHRGKEGEVTWQQEVPDAFDTSFCCVVVCVAWWVGTALFELWHLREDMFIISFKVDWSAALWFCVGLCLWNVLWRGPAELGLDRPVCTFFCCFRVIVPVCRSGRHCGVIWLADWLQAVCLLQANDRLINTHVYWSVH